MNKPITPKSVPDFDTEEPLKPLEGEPARAAQALKDYAQMGSRRSIKALLDRYAAMEEEWKKSKTGKIPRPPTVRRMTLSNYSVKYRWGERVRAYDEIIRLKEQRIFEDDQKKWRAHRLRAAKNLLSRAIVGLNAIDPASATLAQISKTLQIASEQLRIEFGEEKQISTVTDITIRVVREDKKPMDDGAHIS